MKKGRKLRVAFIGCGGISGVHAGPLSQDKRVEITKLADTSPKMLKRFKERFPALAGLPEYGDYRDVLDDVDAVTIQTPHTLHYPQIMAALDAGCHVLCEKPLVCKTAHARKVIAKVRQTGLKLQVAYQRRTDPAYNYIRDQIRSGGIGKLGFLSVVLCQEWKHLTKGSWRQDPALSGGGQVNDSGSHIVDMLLWMANQKPVCVTAFSDNRGTRVDIDTAISVQFDKGALASISVIGNARRWDERWFISGSEAMLLIDNGFKRIDGYGSAPKDMVVPKKSFKPVSINWVDAIYGKARLMSPPSGVLNVVRLTEAIWKSAASGGKPVRIPRAWRPPPHNCRG